MAVIGEQEPWVGGWWLRQELGGGGQGRVYLAYKLGKAEVENFTERFRKSTAGPGHIRVSGMPLIHGLDLFFEAFELFQSIPRGALKKFHANAVARNPSAQPHRIRREIEVMNKISHKGLVRIIDHGDDWLVTPFFKNGTLAQIPNRYCGKPRAAISAIKPIVEGVAVLHRAGHLHRDIKPENIFVRNNRSLVLGDFGLVLSNDGSERVTATSENVGTRDFMPVWANGYRDDEPLPEFDNFCLAKVLWWMLSGGKRMRAHLFDVPETDLRKQFGGVAWTDAIHDFFEGVLVDRPHKARFRNADELAHSLDRLAHEFAIYSQVPG